MLQGAHDLCMKHNANSCSDVAEDDLTKLELSNIHLPAELPLHGLAAHIWTNQPAEKHVLDVLESFIQHQSLICDEQELPSTKIAGSDHTAKPARRSLIVKDTPSEKK